jgi:hypothetical protein
MKHFPIRRLIGDTRGATVIEFAFAFPALIVLIYCIAQLGMVYRAMSGIQHSLGEGARFATIYPRPTTDAIEAKMEAAVYGIGPGDFEIPEPDEVDDTILLKVTYTQPTSLLLFPGPTITVERTKLVYTDSDS